MYPSDSYNTDVSFPSSKPIAQAYYDLHIDMKILWKWGKNTAITLHQQSDADPSPNMSYYTV